MMTDFFALGFLQRALAAAILVSLLCGVLSTFVVLRRMAFIGVGISHSAFGGVALGFLVGIDPLWTGIGFALVVVLLADLRGRDSVALLGALQDALHDAALVLEGAGGGQMELDGQ